jgi:hypothetical protein
MEPSVIVEELMKILDLNDEKDEKIRVNCNSTKSSKDYKNYIGGNSTTNGKSKSYVHPTISTKFGKLINLWNRK